MSGPWAKRWAPLAWIVLAIGAPRTGDTCSFVASGERDDTLEGARPILRAGVEAPTLVSANEETLASDDGGGCGGAESTCEDVDFTTLTLEGPDFTRVVEVGSEGEFGVPRYHRPTSVSGDRKTYSALRTLCAGETLELAALYEDTDPAERSPPVRIRCEDVRGADCPPCS
jgi:hypothetical protein